MPALRNSGIMLAASLTTAACFSTTAGGHSGLVAPDTGVSVLYVSNSQDAPVKIDLLRDGTVTRLGTVPAHTRRAFELLLPFYAGKVDARLRATSMAPGAPSVQYTVTFWADREFEFHVASQLRRSRVRRPRDRWPSG